MKFKWLCVCIIILSCETKINKLDTLIPQPVNIEKHTGEFHLSAATTIFADFEFAEVASYLNDKIESLTTLKLQSGSNSQDGIVLKKLQDQNNLGKEGYLLTINKNSVIVSANEPNGVFYGIQTLLQLISLDNSLTIPCGKITDVPRFSWRGYMLDLARMFYPIESIKKHIDILALHKMNTLHLHLTDDEGGWRIEIKKYPRLTELGAWRKNARCMEPGVEKGDTAYGGFYTQEELKDLVNYANQRFVTLIPEIEMPGHSAAAIYAYPSLSCTGKVYKKDKPGTFEFADPLCPGDEKTFEFMENVLLEVMEIFPSQYIHIGGDECKRTPWEKCPKCQKRIKDEGLKDVAELQSYFTKRIEKFVAAKGKRIIGWDEILEGGIAPEATVMSWRGEEGGIVAAKAGHDVIMAPNTHVYFDYWQTDDHNLDPTGMIGVNKLDRVYSYEPLPTQLNAEEAKHVLGVQGCLWTTMVVNPSDLEVRTLPRLCTLSELAWTPAELKDFVSFKSRMFSHYSRLMKYDFGFYIPIPSGLSEYVYFSDKAKVSVSADIPMATIRYTTDNSEPTLTSMVYAKPLEISETTILKFRTYMPDGKSSPVTQCFCQKVKNMDPLTLEKIEPGLNVSYFNKSIETIDDIKKLKADSSFVLEQFRIPGRYNENDYFALEYKGYLQIENDGDYTFYTTSDDGSSLYLNDNLLVSNDGVHGKMTKQGKVFLKKGMYKIRVPYFDGHWGQSLTVEYEGPGISKQEIPGKILFH